MTRIVNRGYTGHEHIDEFGVVNMNGRVYDPLTAMFLSPDPFIQAPDNWVNYNRYGYCYGNPFKYTDPSGEFFIIDSWISGFFRGLFQGKNIWNTANLAAMNDIKIWGGLFKSDSNKGFLGRVWEVTSRFTWQLPQTIIGFVFSQVSNLAWQVNQVDYWGGATVLRGNFYGQGDGSAITLSSYINGGESLKADPNNLLFQHEYGHYLQSQAMGWAYLPRVGIPSIMSADGSGNHKYQPFEQDANRRAFLYFNENVEGFYQTEGQYLANKWSGVEKGWDFRGNPLDVYQIGRGSIGQYRDYNNSGHRALINNLSLKPRWFDYFGWFGGIPGALAVGIGNGIYYRNNRIK